MKIVLGAPEADPLLREVYQLFEGKPPTPDMEEWEVIREIMAARHRKVWPDGLTRELWQDCLRRMQEARCLSEEFRSLVLEMVVEELESQPYPQSRGAEVM